jgi:hypothetical protein
VVVVGSEQIVAKFPEVTEDNIIQLGPNHVIFSDYYTFELTKDGECLELSASMGPALRGGASMAAPSRSPIHGHSIPMHPFYWPRHLHITHHGAYFNFTSTSVLRGWHDA